MPRYYTYLCLIISFLYSSCESNNKPILPNIVILYADDMGYGDLTIQNAESKIPTPHLDRLAREGMRFTDGHSSSGICTPSRYALLTGRYHWRKFHNIVNVFESTVFDSSRITLPEMLQVKGYHTACIGKWHLGWDWTAIRKPEIQPEELNGREVYPPQAFDWSRAIPDGPLAHGFDYYFGDDVPNFPPYAWIENDRVLIPPTLPLIENPPTAEGHWEARPGPMAAGWELDEVMPALTKRAVAWIKEQKDAAQPFFLYFPWTSPHAPIVPTAQFQGQSEANGYGDFVVQSDWTAGQVLRAIEENDFYDNTIVIFTSDNGPEYYAYDRIRKYNHRSMGPFRGLKRDIWEGGHRVPFVIRWPGHIKPGSESNALISQIDVMATVAAIVGYKLPTGTAEDSQNQLPVLLDQAPEIRKVLVHNTFENRYAIRRDHWVLIDGPSGGHTSVPEWFDDEFGYRKNALPGALYDLNSDPAQKNNLYARHPQLVKALQHLLSEIRTPPPAAR